MSKNGTITLPEWQEIVNQAILWDYGTFKSHKELSEMIYLHHTDQKYRSTMSTASRKLVEHGKMLKNLRSKGYIVVHPDDYLNESFNYQLKARKNIDKSHNILVNAPMEFMSESAKIRHKIIYERSTTMQAMLHGGIKEVKMLNQSNKIQIRGGKI